MKIETKNKVLKNFNLLLIICGTLLGLWLVSFPFFVLIVRPFENLTVYEYYRSDFTSILENFFYYLLNIQTFLGVSILGLVFITYKIYKNTHLLEIDLKLEEALRSYKKLTLINLLAILFLCVVVLPVLFYMSLAEISSSLI